MASNSGGGALAGAHVLDRNDSRDHVGFSTVSLLCIRTGGCVWYQGGEVSDHKQASTKTWKGKKSKVSENERSKTDVARFRTVFHRSAICRRRL